LQAAGAALTLVGAAAFLLQLLPANT
jgi:hypothetical protein